MYNEAIQYTVCDSFFHSAFGGSFLNQGLRGIVWVEIDDFVYASAGIFIGEARGCGPLAGARSSWHVFSILFAT
jgi:phospholipase C